VVANDVMLQMIIHINCKSSRAVAIVVFLYFKKMSTVGGVQQRGTLLNKFAFVHLSLVKVQHGNFKCVFLVPNYFVILLSNHTARTKLFSMRTG
jgi:hypothetical protein